MGKPALFPLAETWLATGRRFSIHFLYCIESAPFTASASKGSISRGSISSLIPSRIWSIRFLDSRPTYSPKSALHTVNICEILTTLCFGRLASPGANKTFPGATARLEIGSERTNDDGFDTTPIEDVVLNDNVGMQQGRAGTGRFTHIDPVDVALTYHHSPSTSLRCRRCIPWRRICSASSGPS